MTKITKSQRQGISLSLLLLPLFLCFAGAVGLFTRNWWIALPILGSWWLLLLFTTSWWFQILVTFGVAIYACSQRYWLVVLGCVLLAARLYQVRKLTDQAMVGLPERLHTISPMLGMFFEAIDNPSKHPVLASIVFTISALLVGIMIWFVK